MKEKLNGKDLINIGIFSAIYFVIVFITAMLGMVPILYPMLTVICPLVGGVVYMLFLTKVKKFGMIWIMSILMGILMLISGMSWYALAIGVFSAPPSACKIILIHPADSLEQRVRRSAEKLCTSKTSVTATVIKQLWILIALTYP
jgi:hypothetical protein